GQASLVRIGAPQTGLAVTVEAKVRVQVAAALDRLVELVRLGELVAPALARGIRAHDHEREEIAADEGEDPEEHGRAEDDLLVEVRVEGASVSSRSCGFRALAARVSRLSGFVSTMSVPFVSAMWKRSSGRGAGPPSTTAVCLS